MIIEEKKLDVVKSSNFETENFSIDLNDPKIFEMLSSGVYVNPIKAVIREISINALDSQKEANSNNQFVVHLPTNLEPWFSVRDYGTGMDHATCMKLYTKYGYSTKSSTNDFTGCLGIGSKAPLSIVDSFLVESFLNGEKNTYSIYKNERGLPKISLLTNGPTDEDNGICIKVNIKHKNNQFIQYAKEVFEFFDEKDMPIINSAEVNDYIKIKKDSIVLDDKNFTIYKPSGSYRNGLGVNNLKAVMGNIAYNIPNDLIKDNDYFCTCSGYLKFDIGDLSFNTGRESLSLDEKTKKSIRDKIEISSAKICQTVKEEVDKEPTFFKKVRKMEIIKTDNKLSRILMKQPWYNSYVLPKSSKTVIVHASQYYSNCETMFTNIIPVGNNVDYYWEKPKYKGRIVNYLNQHRPYKIVLLDEEMVKECKIDKDVIKDLDTLPKKIVESNVNPKNKLKVFKINESYFKKNINYSYTDSSKFYESIKIEDTAKELVYVEINRYKLKCSLSENLLELSKSMNRLNEKFNIKNNFNDLYFLKSSFLKQKVFTENKN